MTSAIARYPLYELVIERPKSTIKVRDSSAIGPVPFYTSGIKIARHTESLCSGENIYVATGGKANFQFLDGPAAYSTDTYVITGTNRIETKYLYYFLTSQTEFIDENLFRGAALRHLSRPEFKSLQVPLPPLPEQQRIVRLLDEAFEGIAVAKANADKNLQNARELFESQLQAIVAQDGEGWAMAKLEEIVEADCSLSYGIVQPGEGTSTGLPIVRPTDLTSKVIQLDGLKRIDPQLAEGYKRTTLRGGELLLCVRGSTGGVGISSAELSGGNVTRGIVPIRIRNSVVLPDLGYFLMKSDHVQRQIREKTYGTALSQINIRDLRKITIRIPPFDTQPTLLANLNSLDTQCAHLSEFFNTKSRKIGDLGNALLNHFFSENHIAA